MATPGHTAGCLSFLWRDRLFCGGLLAVDACPFQRARRCRRHFGTASPARSSPCRPRRCCSFGHARQSRTVSNVLEQRRWHPWFGGASRDEFLARVHALAASSTHNDFQRP